MHCGVTSCALNIVVCMFVSLLFFFPLAMKKYSTIVVGRVCEKTCAPYWDKMRFVLQLLMLGVCS